MRKTLSAIAIVAALWPVEGVAAHCRLGLLYRPSRGTCVTPRAFERELGPRRNASRWERHRGRRFRALAHAGRRGREEEPEVLARAPAPSLAEPAAQVRPAVPRDEAKPDVPSPPYVVNGNLSLNPMPRWGGTSVDLARRAGPVEATAFPR